MSINTAQDVLIQCKAICIRRKGCRKAKVNTFLDLKPEEKLNELFRDQKFLDLLSKGKAEALQTNSEIYDIYNGEEYRKFFEPGEFLRSGYNISFTLNTDGVNKYKSSKASNIWPVYLIINELPKEYRYQIDYMIPAMVYCDRSKPDMITFLIS